VDGGILKHSISYLIYRTHRATAHAWVNRWGESGLRYPYYDALVLIGNNPGIVLVEIALFLGIDKSRVSELLDAMDEEHLIERRRLASDQRSVGIYLTPAATTKLASLIEQVTQYERRTIDSLFTEAERTTLLDLLGRLVSVS
jgi:DNA-binding MarR family transcriptional regulator